MPHLLTLKPKNAYGLSEDTYVADTLNYAESVARGEAVLDFPINLRPFVASEDWNGRRILWVRGGGIGDILFCLPAIREMKKRWPQCEITFACFEHFRQILDGLEYVDRIERHPMPVSAFSKFDAYVYLEEMHDKDANTHGIHAVDLVLHLVGLDTENKELDYNLTFQEKRAAHSRSPKLGNGRIGIQLSASAACRSWPRTSVIEFSKLAIQEGYQVVWFGHPGESGVDPKKIPAGLVDATAFQPALSLRESVAFMSTCDGFLGVDSGLLHAAGAIGLPAIGLYGPFPSKIRTAYADSIKAIDGQPILGERSQQPCGPCHHHPGPLLDAFPASGPCHYSRRCEVLASIKPDEVLKRMIRHIRKSLSKNGAQV